MQKRGAGMAERLAISCIAWPPAQEAPIARLLADEGIGAIEAVPARFLGMGGAKAYRRFWQDHGIKICALQALLFGAPPFQLFGTAVEQAAMAAHLTRVIEAGGEIGAKALVFGAPSQRQRGVLAFEEALARAAAFFRPLAETAAACGTQICIEPNPPQYGCDFICTAAEGAALVAAIDHPGFGLHLDAGGLRLMQEPPAQALAGPGVFPRHFHISEPDLTSLGLGDTTDHHRGCAAALSAAGYEGYCSIEMRPGADPARAVQHALAFARRNYQAVLQAPSAQSITK